AALKSAAAVSRPVVDHHAQHVLPGFAECGGGGGGAAHSSIASFRLGELNSRPRVSKRDVAWSAEFAPGQNNGRSLRRLHPHNRLGVVGNPQRQRQRIGRGSRERRADRAWTLYGGPVFESDRRRRISTRLQEG